MSEEKFDVIIVGGGMAGCTCAYLLAKAGLETLVIERGNFPGAKNVTGGRMYAHGLEKIFPNFAEKAPVERCIVREKLSFMDDERSTTMDYVSPKSESAAARSYSVLRAKFDPWLAEQAEETGASIVSGIKVDDVLVRDGKVCGVVAAGEAMESDVVILADGVNSILAQKLGMATKVTPENCAVGVKEVIQLSEQQINDRFGCTSGEGTAWLFVGMPSAGEMGGGFLYTNQDSLSLGLVCGLHNIAQAKKSVPQMLEDFKKHPTIAPLIEGGKMLEYAAHLVPEGGQNMMPELVGDGVLVVGDAAGLCMNVGFTIRGMDMAVASAEAAAHAVINAKIQQDFSKQRLNEYVQHLEKSFVMHDLKLYRKVPKFLNNPRMFNQYPEMVNGIMQDMFTVNGISQPMRKIVMPHLKKVGFFNLIKDGFKGVTSL